MAHTPKQDKRLPSEKIAYVRPPIACHQVALTSIPTKLSTKKTGGGVPTSQVSESHNNISDQVPGGKRQVLAHNIRHVPYCLTSQPPHVHS